MKRMFQFPISLRIETVLLDKILSFILATWRIKETLTPLLIWTVIRSLDHSNVFATECFIPRGSCNASCPAQGTSDCCIPGVFTAGLQSKSIGVMRGLGGIGPTLESQGSLDECRKRGSLYPVKSRPPLSSKKFDFLLNVFNLLPVLSGALHGMVA